MSWIAVGGAAVSAVAGWAGGQSKKRAEKRAFKNQMKMLKEEQRLGLQTSAFESAQDYYYQQLEKKERQRGMDEFRKFNTVQEFSPGYTNQNTGPVLPEKPNTGDYT